MLKAHRKNEAIKCMPSQSLVLITALLVISWLLSSPAMLLSESVSRIAGGATLSVDGGEADPNKPASELNHHLAGYALLAIAVLVFLGESSEKTRFCRYIWPLLFIVTGVFLAVWSDREIWPRGDLSWTWLIHHDFEARQHKVFALLLFMIGIVEYARTRDHLSRFWRTWAFPVLALSGTCLLLFHDHTQGSGASSPEAKEYRVSWSIAPTESIVQADNSPQPVETHHHHDHGTAQVGATSDMQSTTGDSAGDDGMHMAPQAGAHHHHMTASQMKVERQHLWFVIVGVGVAFMKLLNDGGFWKRPFVPFLWPSLMGVLGLLLIVYTE